MYHLLQVPPKKHLTQEILGVAQNESPCTWQQFTITLEMKIALVKLQDRQYLTVLSAISSLHLNLDGLSYWLEMRWEWEIVCGNQRQFFTEILKFYAICWCIINRTTRITQHKNAPILFEHLACFVLYYSLLKFITQTLTILGFTFLTKLHSLFLPFSLSLPLPWPRLQQDNRQVVLLSHCVAQEIFPEKVWEKKVWNSKI